MFHQKGKVGVGKFDIVSQAFIIYIEIQLSNFLIFHREEDTDLMAMILKEQLGENHNDFPFKANERSNQQGNQQAKQLCPFCH